MYVVRPQFFIPIITLLRNAAMNSIQYKAELALVRSQNIDITNFEEKMNNFKEGFARNYDLASRKFKDAIDGIDKTIDNLPSQQTCSNLKEEMKMNFSTYEPNSNVVIVSSICVNKTTGVIE